MQTADILALVRQKAGDVDSAAYRYTDSQLEAILPRVLRNFQIRGKVANLDKVSYDTASNVFSPEPTDMQGSILALATAVEVLWQTYRGRVDRGEIGVIWKSGLEEESTVSQQKAYEGMVRNVETELAELIIFANINTFATRPQ